MQRKLFKLTVSDTTALTMIARRDAEELFALTDANRAYLREWLPWLDATQTVDDTRNFIQAAIAQHARNEGFQCCMRFENKIAGVIGFHHIDWNNRLTAMGYWLAQPHQGRGIVTQCCRALVDLAFSELQLNRVAIRAAERNLKSRAIPERLGFVKEGVQRQAEWLYDHYVDLVMYSMLKRDWH
jgi:ribosomal-protein-serine acetyltransferase